ncbi:DgyrCDS7193 [Dimorphilus gyrociliatus]|uniref:DgyrCDS7193 n=1 Tax=Dimorphilus gyrociliatus TaxID=2664684 RepID=A0A7I8VQA3_9ANNE|nr:DgyrCDS7193 [Dimorphilus gyrociliatus]
MGDHEKKAQDLMAQAEKKTKSGGIFGMFGGSSKSEEAAELYDRAANSFKMAKNWNGAGKAFSQSAQIYLKLNSKHEAASHYVDAGNAYKKCDVNEAVSCITKAIEIYTDMGKFTIAAKHHITIAEIFENDMIDIEKAITHYEQAADYYKGEESNSSANKCLLKVAQYAAQMEQYEKAIDIYETIGKKSLNTKLTSYGAPEYFFRALLIRLIQDHIDTEIAMEKYQKIYLILSSTKEFKFIKIAQAVLGNQLLKYSAADHLFKAALCRLAMDKDVTDANTALEKYEKMMPSFADKREAKLLKKLIEAIEDSNPDNFADAVKEYDSISRLDQWYTAILLKIKKGIEGDADLR